MTDEKLYLMADAIDAYFSGEIQLQEVEDYTSLFLPTEDQKVRKKKKYYVADGDGYKQITPDGEENPEAVGWYEREYIRNREFKAELDRLTCHHPHCNQNNRCRASFRRSGGTMCCTVLTDTRFIGHTCPFFKTKEEYDGEFWRTYVKEKPIITGGHARQIIRIKPAKKGA